MARWDNGAGDDRDVLWRIVALLLALARLADLAARLSGCRRRDLLAILSWSEAKACDFVIGMGAVASDPADQPGPRKDAPCQSYGAFFVAGHPPCRANEVFRRPEDAAVLAARLRMLALMLCYILANTAPFTLHRVAGLQAGRCRNTKAARPCRHAASRAFDTS